MRTETKTKKEYLNEIIEIADEGDIIKFTENGIVFFNDMKSILSEWKNTNIVIYY